MVSTVDNAKNVNEAHEGVVKGLLNTGSIIAAFVKLGKYKVTFFARATYQNESQSQDHTLGLGEHLTLQIC